MLYGQNGDKTTWSNQTEWLCFDDGNDAQFIQNRVKIYQNASQLVPKKNIIKYDDKQYCINIDNQLIPTHGVRLYEIQCCLV